MVEFPGESIFLPRSVVQFFEVWKWYCEVNFLISWISSNSKLEAYIGRGVVVAFMEFAIVIHCYFVFLLKEVGKYP